MKGLAYLQIFLLIGATISFSYLIREASPEEFLPQEESSLVSALRILVINLLGNNLVSAVEQGIWTCLQDKQGSFCQEYPASTCTGLCNSSCFPGRRADFAECALGTCVDSQTGNCAPQSPKKLCEQSGGLWKNQQASELVECRRGCCLTGDQAQYVTERTCQTIEAQLGLTSEFRPVENELACLALSNQQAEGACVIGSADLGDISCRFTKKADCQARGGAFYDNTLCSNPELRTGCEKQARIGCMPNKNEVYWFDSCGNRENIYDANKVKSWNLGKILGKNQSCELGSGNNPLARQASCGNCDYLQGSVCGTPRAQDSRPADGNAVCRDLNCIDEQGNKRKHGESWCAFESQIGVQGTGNAQRSVDLPGSTHYRKVCFEGEIKIEPCQGFRNEVCVESRNEQAGFSEAQCRINQWQKCFQANTDTDKLAQCEQTTDCVLKTVNLGKDFKFDRCVPRDPPGFDLQEAFGGEVGESLCEMGSQKCTVVYQKNFKGKWKCKANCQCRTAAFTEAMNNLCISIGDCGADVNILGDFTEGGYRVSKAPKLNQNYISGLKALTTPKEGQKVAPLSAREIAQLLNLDPGATPAQQASSIGDFLGYVGLGGTGLTFAAVAYNLGFDGAVSLFSGELAFNPFGTASTFSGTSLTTTGAFLNGLAGAAAGAAIGYLIGKAFGVQGEGLIAITIAGAVGGGLAAVGILPALGQLVTIFSVAIWAAGFAIAALLVIKLLGIGKTKKVIVEFQCKPWQPPKGGAKCDQCGKNGLPCSRYQCQSLGQLCEFVNEGTSEEACINSNPNDVLAPIISPFDAALLPGFSYVGSGTNGYTLRGPGSDGCIPAYNQVRFGITLNERAACKVDSVRTSNFDLMEFDFGSSNLYKINHTQVIFAPSLDALNQTQAEGVVQDDEEPADPDPLVVIDPTKRNDFNLYVRCQDRAGNSNVNEYAISFCISPAPDKTAPIINQFTPPSPAYSAFGTATRNVSFYVNEPAQCRWSTADSDYDVMSQQATCGSDVVDVTLFGYACNALLPVSADTNTFYFRCKDQPWLTGNITLDNGKTRNKNAQSSVYIVKKTISPLKIDSVKPSNQTISGGGLPISVNLEVQTSGGAEGSARYCEFNPGAGFVQFFESGTNRHRQPGLLFIEARNYSIPIRCRDTAGNEANANSMFSLFVDRDGPKITRAYQQNGITIITNEPATCQYSFTSCSSSQGNLTLLSGNELVHSTSFNRTATYYFTCRDRFDNPGTCLSVRGGVF